MDPAYELVDFGQTTSTSVLRRHLFESHLDLWIAACDNMKIKITAKEALPVIEAYRQEPQKTQLEAARPEFSKEAFLDALVEFIVADDQVSFNSINIFFTNNVVVIECC
jgi:hypothetical protein